MNAPPRSDLRSPPPQGGRAGRETVPADCFSPASASIVPDGGAASGPAEPDPLRPLAGAELGRLRWRCRRGLLENDLFIERFFRQHEAGLTVHQAQGLQRLMDLADNDLLDLLLARREPEGELARAEVHEVLAQLRTQFS